MLVGPVHIVRGNGSDLPALLTLLRSEGVATSANPDLYVRSYRSFGVDDAREIAERASAHALMGRRVFVVVATSMTHEAQNALLKTFEEAPLDALFVLLHPAPETLLSTVRSRAQTLALPRPAALPGDIDPAKFLAARPAQRLEMLKPLLEKGDDDTRDLSAILAFLASIEHALVPRLEEKAARDGLRAVLAARRFVADRGALVKPLLEEVALLV